MRASPTIMPETPAFTVTNVHKQFTLSKHVIPVLNGIDLQVESGEWIALVGPSGSGKTTLLHLLAALDCPSQGEICCHGESLKLMSARKRAFVRRTKIGLVFQSYHLFAELNAVENAVLPALNWGWNRRAAVSRATELLIEFGLGARLEHRPQELSGGEQQRVALARALINNPQIILADEPTGNLDQDSGDHIMAILKRLHHEDKKTVIMVTHDLDLAACSNRILRLKDGRVVSS